MAPSSRPPRTVRPTTWDPAQRNGHVYEGKLAFQVLDEQGQMLLQSASAPPDLLPQLVAEFTPRSATMPLASLAEQLSKGLDLDQSLALLRRMALARPDVHFSLSHNGGMKRRLASADFWNRCTHPWRTAAHGVGGVLA